MNAEIVAVGSELLTPRRTDTNSLYLTDQLNALGIEVIAKSVVGDDRERLAAAVRDAAARAEIVITTGGLGPTEDDVTRDAVAQALGRKLVYREELLADIEARFRKMRRKMAESNRRQAHIIDGSEAMENERGTAPGLWVPNGEGRVLVLLPGPPIELEYVFRTGCLPRFEQLAPLQAIRTRIYRVTGLPESTLDERIAPVYSKYSNPVTTVLAAPGDIQVHLRARCKSPEEAEALLDEVGSGIEKVLGDRIYSTDGADMETTIGKMLRDRNATVAVAESCTGGALGSRITAVPGSSDYFLGGFITYTDRLKQELLGVPRALLLEHSAASEAVAGAMAHGARARTGATYALSVTGVAGPEGGTEEIPAGTVFVGLASGEGTTTRSIRFPGDRDRVRRLATQSALDLLRRALL